LRRGDDDDNRTSPHGRGLRSIVLSTILEFNPLKASIGFLALIIGPALLVGIAPSIVVTYSRLMFHKATLAESYPIVALVSLAILVGAALWIGRPLLASAVDHFWHLHYTLVVPISWRCVSLYGWVPKGFLVGRSLRNSSIADAGSAPCWPRCYSLEEGSLWQ
jgi:hypothetical protein